MQQKEEIEVIIKNVKNNITFMKKEGEEMQKAHCYNVGNMLIAMSIRQRST